MSQIPATGNTNNAASNKQTTGGDLRDIDVSKFLDLMIAELQNQDPMNPMDNAAMIEQIGQLREISSTSQLTETLESVMLGQNLSTASALIGREVKALSDDAQDVSGKVDRVSVETGGKDNSIRTLKIHIGDNKIELKNIREIVPSA